MHLLTHLIGEAKSIQQSVEPDWTAPLPPSLLWIENIIVDPLSHYWEPDSLEGCSK